MSPRRPSTSTPFTDAGPVTHVHPDGHITTEAALNEDQYRALLEETEPPGGWTPPVRPAEGAELRAPAGDHRRKASPR